MYNPFDAIIRQVNGLSPLEKPKEVDPEERARDYFSRFEYEAISVDFDLFLLPSGQHNGNAWLETNMWEPARGRYTMHCDFCGGREEGWNWKCSSPRMFMADPFTDGQKYKCQDCKNGVKKEIPYSEYLKTEHWLKVRQEALDRSRSKCQLCASTNRLEVHHNTYDSKGKELPEDVIVLCRKCHSKHHGKVE
jgi:hypothetical protein